MTFTKERAKWGIKWMKWGNCSNPPPRAINIAKVWPYIYPADPPPSTVFPPLLPSQGNSFLLHTFRVERPLGKKWIKTKVKTSLFHQLTGGPNCPWQSSNLKTTFPKNATVSLKCPRSNLKTPTLTHGVSWKARNVEKGWKNNPGMKYQTRGQNPEHF